VPRKKRTAREGDPQGVNRRRDASALLAILAFTLGTALLALAVALLLLLLLLLALAHAGALLAAFALMLLIDHRSFLCATSRHGDDTKTLISKDKFRDPSRSGGAPPMP
jgi:hypothetical protein